jgi:Predicted transcriptional regulator with an HTH domain
MGIGTKLTRLMKEQDTNANELAKKAGVPAQTIYSLIRRDAKKVDIDVLIKIARALGVTAEYFSNEDIDTTNDIAAHFDGEQFTEEQMKRIKEYALFIKQQDG